MRGSHHAVRKHRDRIIGGPETKESEESGEGDGGDDGPHDSRELDFEERQALYVSVAAELSDGWGAQLEERRMGGGHTVGVFDDNFAFELVDEEPKPLVSRPE